MCLWIPGRRDSLNDYLCESQTQSLCLWRINTEKDRTTVEESSVITEIRVMLCQPRKQQRLLIPCFQPSEDNFGLLTSIMWDNEASPGLHSVCVGEGHNYILFLSFSFSLISQAGLELSVQQGTTLNASSSCPSSWELRFQACTTGLCSTQDQIQGSQHALLGKLSSSWATAPVWILFLKTNSRLHEL